MLALLPSLAAFCSKNAEPSAPTEKPANAKVCELRLSSNRNFDLVDVFIYEDSGLLQLEAYGRWTLPEGKDAEVCFELSPGEKRVIAIANCPYEFNMEAIGSYSAVEAFVMPFKDDNPRRPLLSGASQFRTGDGPAGIVMRSHLCRIEIGEINSSSLERLEDLRFSISDYATFVEPLRTSGFHPESLSSDTSGLKGLIWDGRESLRPGEFCGTSLYCYPNESEIRPSILHLEYIENGKRRKVSKPLLNLKSGEVRLEGWELR